MATEALKSMVSLPRSVGKEETITRPPFFKWQGFSAQPKKYEEKKEEKWQDLSAPKKHEKKKEKEEKTIASPPKRMVWRHMKAAKKHAEKEKEKKTITRPPFFKWQGLSTQPKKRKPMPPWRIPKPFEGSADIKRRKVAPWSEDPWAGM